MSSKSIYQSEPIYYIYVISNIKNNSLYIGVTNDPERRMKEHMSLHSKKHLVSKVKSAVKKYGPENFTMTVIYCTRSKDHVYEMEKFLISEYNTLTPNGYNIHPGGYGGSKKGSMSEDGRRRLREANLNRPVTEEFRQKVSERVRGEGNPMYGKTHTEEVKQRLSDFFTGRKNPFTEEHKENLARANRERVFTEEEIERCRQLGYANRGRKQPPRSDEYRKAMSDLYKGKPRPKTVCPHCGKEGGVGGMQKWHFDNCKQNPAKNLLQTPTPMCDED